MKTKYLNKFYLDSLIKCKAFHLLKGYILLWLKVQADVTATGCNTTDAKYVVIEINEISDNI